MVDYITLLENKFKLKDIGKEIPMPRATRDGDLFNELFPKNPEVTSEVSRTDWPDAPEYLRTYLDALTAATGILPSVKQDRKYQIKEAEGWHGEFPGDVDLLKSAISRMKSINYNISSIGSLRKTARGMKVRRREDTHEDRQKYLKWIE